ncbi:hypothetical protein CsSME_00029339 [Camellia sinensis var. sinensis]
MCLSRKSTTHLRPYIYQTPIDVVARYGWREAKYVNTKQQRVLLSGMDI